MESFFRAFCFLFLFCFLIFSMADIFRVPGPFIWSSILSTRFRRARKRFRCWDLALPHFTWMPVTTCLTKTAEADLFTFCPPRPDALMNLNSISFLSIFNSVIFFSRASILSFPGPIKKTCFVWALNSTFGGYTGALPRRNSRESNYADVSAPAVLSRKRRKVKKRRHPPKKKYMPATGYCLSLGFPKYTYDVSAVS